MANMNEGYFLDILTVSTMVYGAVVVVWLNEVKPGKGCEV